MRLSYKAGNDSEATILIGRRVKLSRNGRNQGVRIPCAFELPGEEAVLREDGDSLILSPTPPKSLLAVLARLAPIDEGFSPILDPLLEPVEF